MAGYHGAEPAGLEAAGRGNADEHVRAAQGRFQRAAGGAGRVAPLHCVQVGAVFAQDALGIAHQNRARPGFGQHVGDPDAGGPRAVDHAAQGAQRPAAQPAVIQDARQGNDRRPPLVVVEHRGVQLLVQPALDLEAGRRGDILQVDAAVLGRHPQHGFDHPLGIGLSRARAAEAAVFQRRRPGLDVAEGLEQHRLAFHDRDAGGRAQIAEAEDGRAVADHGHEIRLGGTGVNGLRPLGDFPDRQGHAGGVGQRQRLRPRQRLGQRHADLAALVILQNFFSTGFHGIGTMPRRRRKGKWKDFRLLIADCGLVAPADAG